MEDQKPTNTTGFGYLDYLGPSVDSGDVLARLNKLANDQAKAEAEVAKKEAELTQAKEKLRDIAERQLPELMDSVGYTELKTASGLEVSIDEKIRASIPKAKAPQSIAWLKANGHGALVKRVISVAFGKGEDEDAEKLFKKLDEGDYEVEDNAGVHPSTLASFVKKKLEAGEDIPMDLFGVHRQRVAKIGTPKKK